MNNDKFKYFINLFEKKKCNFVIISKNVFIDQTKEVWYSSIIF